MFKNRIRLPLHITTPQFPVEANRFRLANGDKKTLSAVVRKLYVLKTDYLNEQMHQRLVIALNHDEVTIEGDKYIGGVALDSGYEIEWPDFLDYPLAQATATLEVTPFDVTNSNCQTCDVLSQLALVDDDIGELELESTNDINVYANDSICCFPPEAEIVFFNTTYLNDATIVSATGVVTLTVKADAPTVGSIVLATYLVTCPDGSYDEADIYGSIAGESGPCEQPSEVEVGEFSEPPAPFDVTVTWGAPNPVPDGGFEWQLFRCDTPGTLLQSGSGMSYGAGLTDLEPSTDYCFYVRSVCAEGVYSTYTSYQFTTPASETENCGNFNVTVDDGTPNRNSYPYSFMNCLGVIQNRIGINLQDYDNCMLMDAFNQPVYFESTDPYFTVTYIEPC